MVESARHELDAVRLDTLAWFGTSLRRRKPFTITPTFPGQIAPLAEQTVTAKQLGYETDKAGFLELLTAQQSAREVESMYWDISCITIWRSPIGNLVGAPLAPATSPTEHHHESK